MGHSEPLSEIIATIQKENEHLLNDLEQAKNLKTVSTQSGDFQSVSNGKSMSEIIESQNKIIQDLTQKLKESNKIQIKSNQKIKELQKKNKKLQNGYIRIESHYQSLLEHQRAKSKSLE